MNPEDVSKLKQDIVFEVQLREHRFVFHSTWGLFSPRSIDEGSYLLINHMEVNPDDITLELGCGYGPIGLAIAQLSPLGKVHMVDKDFVAIEYTKKNAQLNGIQNCEIYLSNAFSHVPDLQFDNIVSNLPAKVGKELFYIIMNDAKRHLKKGGKFYVVTISGLREYIKRNFHEVFGNYEKLKQGKTYTVAVARKE